MTCTSGVDAVNSYLVPQLDLGLRIIPHSQDFMKKLQSWTNQLQDDILLAQGGLAPSPESRRVLRGNGDGGSPSVLSLHSDSPDCTEIKHT